MTKVSDLAVAHCLKALSLAKGNPEAAIAYVEAQHWRDTAMVSSHLRSVVTAENTTLLDATPLAVDFSSAVRPRTVLGRLPGVVRVPFLARIVTGISGVTAGFVGRGKPIPVSAADLDGQTLGYKKVAGIVVIADELVQSSRPQSDVALNADMVGATAQGIDMAFLNPANGGDDDTPAAVTAGVTALTSSGSTVAQIDADLRLMVQQLIAVGSTLSNAAWILRPATAVHLAGLRDSGGALAFPGVTAQGGTLLGLPVVTAGTLPDPGSPASAQIVLLDGSQVIVADEDQALFDLSKHASLQLLTNPTNSAAAGTATAMVSMYQTNSWAARAVRYINWTLRRPYVSVLTGVNY